MTMKYWKQQILLITVVFVYFYFPVTLYFQNNYILCFLQSGLQFSQLVFSASLSRRGIVSRGVSFYYFFNCLFYNGYFILITATLCSLIMRHFKNVKQRKNESKGKILELRMQPTEGRVRFLQSTIFNGNTNWIYW